MKITASIEVDGIRVSASAEEATVPSKRDFVEAVFSQALKTAVAAMNARSVRLVRREASPPPPAVDPREEDDA